MGKNINVDYKNQHFTLEFNREAIKLLEAESISVNDIEAYFKGKSKKNITILSAFVHRSFYMHHKEVSEDLAMEIFESIPNKDEFLIALVEIYTEPIVAISSNKGDEGNVSWGLNK